MNRNMIFAAICGAVTLIMAIYYLCRERSVKTMMFGALTGGTALLILNQYGSMFSLSLPLNAFNVAGSTVLGVPFVVILVLLKII